MIRFYSCAMQMVMAFWRFVELEIHFGRLLMDQSIQVILDQVRLTAANPSDRTSQ